VPTASSRVLGLVRTVGLAKTVGAASAPPVTANQVPNLIFELAIGGALTSAMVPVLARSASRAATDPQAKAHVAQVSSALMTWSVLILLPVTVAVTAAAAPIAGLLNPVNPNAACAHGDVLNETTFMLVSFAPQILLYGISVVLFGLLQAFRKFGATSLAPVVGNVVTITAYLSSGRSTTTRRWRIPRWAPTALSIGTTMNIGMMVIVSLPSTRRLHLRWRHAALSPASAPPAGRPGRGLEFLAADTTAWSPSTWPTATREWRPCPGQLRNWVHRDRSVLPLAIIKAPPGAAATEGDGFDQTSAGRTARWCDVRLSTAIMVAVACPPRTSWSSSRPGARWPSRSAVRPGVAGTRYHQPVPRAVRMASSIAGSAR
jgi:hypothetical protein